jgi:hypothetical protein
MVREMRRDDHLCRQRHIWESHGWFWSLAFGTWNREQGQTGEDGGAVQRWVCNHTREVVMACMVHRVFPLRLRLRLLRGLAKWGQKLHTQHDTRHNNRKKERKKERRLSLSLSLSFSLVPANADKSFYQNSQ